MCQRSSDWVSACPFSWLWPASFWDSSAGLVSLKIKPEATATLTWLRRPAAVRPSTTLTQVCCGEYSLALIIRERSPSPIHVVEENGDAPFIDFDLNIISDGKHPPRPNYHRQVSITDSETAAPTGTWSHLFNGKKRKRKEERKKGKETNRKRKRDIEHFCARE